MRFLLPVVLACLLFSGCKCEDEDQSPPAQNATGASRCTTGIQKALKAETLAEASSIYYAECSELFSQANCRDAWRTAATLPVAEQIPKVADTCRKAYCPTLTAFAFEICRDDFSPTPENITRAWPPLFDAILAREAGPLAPGVSSSMLVLYARLRQLAAAAPVPPATTPPATAAPSASVAASASAAPSASAVPKNVAKKKK